MAPTPAEEAESIAWQLSEAHRATREALEALAGIDPREHEADSATGHVEAAVRRLEQATKLWASDRQTLASGGRPDTLDRYPQLSKRTKRVLRREGLVNASMIREHKDTLWRYEGFGEKTLAEVRSVI